MRRALGALLAALALLALAACGAERGLTQEETAALDDIFGGAQVYTDLSGTALTKGLSKKFPAVKKVYETADGHWAVIAEPVGYNGPIRLAVGIDAGAAETVGLRIVSHMETDHYVRDMESPWFIGRFAGKAVGKYLELVSQRAAEEHQVVAITGATVSAQAVANGVNAAMGLFSEVALGTAAEAVPEKVRFTPDEATGPGETESVALRAYGVILGEVPLADILEMPSAKRSMTIRSSAGDTTHAFRGTLLSNILDAVDPTLKDTYDSVTVIGVDDYAANISMEQLRMENCVYVMYEDGGEPLPQKSGSGRGLRVVVLDDVFGQRFTNYVLEVVLEKDDQ